MRTTEYFTLAFGCIVGAGWVVVIEEWLTAGGPGGAMLAYLVCGVALVPVALAYGRLAQLLQISPAQSTLCTLSPTRTVKSFWTATELSTLSCS